MSTAVQSPPTAALDTLRARLLEIDAWLADERATPGHTTLAAAYEAWRDTVAVDYLRALVHAHWRQASTTAP